MKTRNVIGIVEGRDAVLKTEAIVIGAHYDHLGRGNEFSLADKADFGKIHRINNGGEVVVISGGDGRVGP